MGIKLFSLQRAPWTCFQLMTNHVACGQIQPEPPAAARTIKLIDSNGSVKIYTRPIPASELMIQFPTHLICRSDSFYVGQKIPALAESDLLQLGHNYFLLPTQFFQSVLSFVNIAAFASAKTTPHQPFRNALMKKAATCRPFDIQKSPSGCLRIRVTDEFISQLMEEGNVVENGDVCEEEEETTTKNGVCSTPQLKKDYKQLVRSRQWRPKLETIRENKEKRKLSSFGMKRRKKSQAKISQKTQQQRSEHHVTSGSSKTCKDASLKGKIKIIRSKKQ
ncbi:hypothetical protein HS088_TW10G00235 [Tripterygium wilfordii]|uniref:DUF4228 domain protein n=1 Tax=Tripterygium wilfordii TaxID=458696 RepID=A0A7J7D4P6_TRIWF|nr:uncharacterized protein LOC120007074 [Tripterygium wilfordii]KAF5741239.1 hypothetical protein HS088_TW10G00235 [Tripterygium wilfordii]